MKFKVQTYEISAFNGIGAPGEGETEKAGHSDSATSADLSARRFKRLVSESLGKYSLEMLKQVQHDTYRALETTESILHVLRGLSNDIALTIQGNNVAVLYTKKRIFYTLFMWLFFAILSSVFAALTSILAKIGLSGVSSNVATAVRTVVVVLMSWLMVFVTKSHGNLCEITKKSWTFLILSGVATGASWLCYYKALQIGEASKVVPIDKLSVVLTLIMAFVFLHETLSVKSILGCVLITAGTLLMVL